MLAKIKQQYTPYWSWGCFNNGMWSKVDKETESEMLKKAIDFTSNHIKYGEQMRIVIYKWPNTMLNHLSNGSINRKAFIGHCAVSYKLNIPEYITRKAWKHLTKKQQIDANNQASTAIKEWEYNRRLSLMKKRGSKDATQQDYQMKFQFQ